MPPIADSADLFASAYAALNTLLGGHSLTSRLFRAPNLFKSLVCPPGYHPRTMSTSHALSTANPSAAFSTASVRPSLTTIALSKPSFRWPAQRPLPTYIATSSRGSIPHLTPDNIQSHTAIQSVHIGLEDFITSPAAKSPILSVQPRIHQFLGLPERVSVVFAARRANPLPINASWDDRIEINTIDGRTTLPIVTFSHAVEKSQLRREDVVIGVPDVTETPGVKRLRKMVQRTQKWLTLLLEQNLECKIYASIPPVTPSRAPALLDEYMDFLAENASRLSGIAIYNIFPDHPITQLLPEELSHLPIFLIPSPLTPHEILRGILTDQVNEFTAGGMVTAMSDLGVALDFKLRGGGRDGEQISLGRDMFDSSNEVDLGPLVDGCECFTCTNHHRAYVHHLLNCHEMTAWVLLQLHNYYVIENFFKDIRKAITEGTFLANAINFDKIYSTKEAIIPGSRGPRVRGHHTSLRREHKKRKLPVASNKGLVGKDADVFSGGEIVERDGKRKHWKQFDAEEEDGGVVMLDEDERVEGELFQQGEVEMVVENGEGGTINSTLKHL